MFSNKIFYVKWKKKIIYFQKPDLIYDDDLKCKEDMLAENEVCESLNRTNGSHINLTVSIFLF